MTVTIDLVVEGSKGDVVLQPIQIVDTVEIGIVSAPEVNFTVEAGAPGPRGPRGYGAQEPVVFTFPEATNPWLCPHDLGYYPASVMVVDGEGNSMLCGVSYDSTAVVRIEFGAPTVGKAFIV